MTSINNYEDTTNFFKENNYFDYPKDCVFFFKQYMDGYLMLLNFLTTDIQQYRLSAFIY